MSGSAALDAHLVIDRSRGDDAFVLDIALAITAGETLALLGPNGSGKSTTVDALAGIIPIDSGHITLAGRSLDKPDERRFVPSHERKIGIVFQDYLLFDHLSVLDNVAFGLHASGLGRSAGRRAAGSWLELFGLSGLADRKPGQLSGGQAQRVAIARAMATEPDLLLLDEALAALDVSTRGELRRLLGSDLAHFAGPRLLITHDPTDAFLLADRIAVIEQGRLTQVGTSHEIRRRPATRYVAALAGTNLLTGTNTDGVLALDEHRWTLQASDTSLAGPVLITIHPTAIALHPERPSGSPRNSWETTVASIEPLGDTTRVTLGGPLPLGVDITPAAASALSLTIGSQVWASVKATEIDVTPAAALGTA